MSLVRRSLPPTRSAAQGRIGDTRIAPKVPSAHVTPLVLSGSRFQLHEGAHRLRQLLRHRHHRDCGAFAPLRESLVASAQTNLHLPGGRENLRRLPLAAVEVGTYRRMVAVVPGGFHENPPYALPVLVMLPRRSLLPLEYSLGTKPTKAANSWA